MFHPLIEPLEARIAPATFSIATPAAISEGNADQDLVFVVSLTGPITSNVTVNFTTKDGSAMLADSDYGLTAGTLTFTTGDSQMEIRVPIRGDNKYEKTNETFTVELSAPNGATLAQPSTATGTITNDDAVPTATIVEDVTVLEGNSGTTNATFTVRLSNPSQGAIRLTPSATGGTATLNTDFTAPAATVLFFAAGETEKTFVVGVTGDTTDEIDETFTVGIAKAATLPGDVNADDTAVGTIKNDERQVTVENVTRVETTGADTTFVFDVRLSAASTHNVIVNYATMDGTATVAGGDYDAASGTLTFAPAGNLMQQVSVTVHGDAVGEFDEAFFLNLTATNATLTQSRVTGAILNDDPALRVVDVEIVEGSAGTRQAVFSVFLDDGPLTGNVTVVARTVDGSATAASGDYTPLPVAGMTLTFQPGETLKTISIPVLGDTTPEDYETFALELSGQSANSTLLRAIGTAKIINDDADLRISDVRVIEGAAGATTQAEFTVTLVGAPTTGVVTVDATLAAGTALAGSDFTALNAENKVTLSFSGTTTTQTISIPIIGDSTVEGNETFTVQLSNASANAKIGQGTATGTILNDDGPVFTVSDATISEGDSGTANATFIVSLLTANTAPLSVKVSTLDGTAVSSGPNQDFTSTSTTLSFPVNTTQLVFTVPVRGDLIKEGAETFRVVLSEATTGVSILRDGIGTITDNGDPTPSVSVAGVRRVEGNGTNNFEFSAMLSQPSDSAVTFTFATADGTALSGSDYTATEGTITFAPGETQATIFIPILGDATDENDETFTLNLANPTGATLANATAVGTLANDDLTVGFDLVASSSVEGNSGTTSATFNVSLNQASGHEVRVNFATLDGTAVSVGANADYNATTGVLTFPAGVTTLPITVTVRGDTLVEPDETFLVRLLSTENATLETGKTTRTVTIANDEPVPVLSVGNASVGEDAPVKQLEFTVRLSVASEVPITVRAKTVDIPGGATAGADYTAFDQVITFQPGQLSQTVIVLIVDDAIDEASAENLRLELSEATGGASLPTGTQATGTILDDDQPTITITGGSAVEGGTLTFVVTLNKAATRQVTVNYSTVTDSATTADFTAQASTLTFLPAVADDLTTTEVNEARAAETQKTITIAIADDAAVEGNEQFFVQLANAGNGTIGGDGRARGTIVDTESTVMLQRVGNAPLLEDGGTFAEYQVVRSGDLSQAVSVEFRTVEGTAKSSGPRPDFTATNGRIAFAAGSNTASATIRVPILGDATYEDNETFQIELFNPVNAGVVTGGTIGINGLATETIIDNEVAPRISIGDREITEGNLGTQTLTFTVQLSAFYEKATAGTVKFDLLDGTALGVGTGTLLADFVRVTDGTVTFSGGVDRATISVTINGDLRDEADDEVFTVKLRDASANLGEITDGEATGTIHDNDLAPVVSVGDLVVAEGDGGTKQAAVVLTLSQISERALSVNLVTRDGTALSTGARPDFTAVSQTVTYLPGSATTINVLVPINGDVVDEPNESFTVLLSNPNLVRIGDGNATVTITDDDNGPNITVGDVSIVEGDAGMKDMVFTVSLLAASDQVVTVAFATKDGLDAMTGAVSSGPLADFVAQSGTLTFQPGETSKEVRVPILGDTFKETTTATVLGDQFTLELSGATNGTVVTGAATGTILADGDTVVGIGIRDGFFVEGSETATRNFTVELSDVLATATTFTATTRAGTAASGRDFAAFSGAPFSIPANTRSGPVAVTLLGDDVFEPTESFFVDLRDVPATLQVADATARGTIFNDDVRQVNARTFQFIDVDGDLVTVHVSKGSLNLGNFAFLDENRDGQIDMSAVGGSQLANINLVNDGREFRGANLSVTASPQAGFNGAADGAQSDGRVNVRAIIAATFDEFFQLEAGIDLGNVVVEGDLGAINAGDVFVTPAIKSLNVQSLGRLGTTTTSTVLSTIQNLYISGVMSGSLRLLGERFGSIDRLFIGGGLVGGSTVNSGTIIFTGKIGSGFIKAIIGGDGVQSGSIVNVGDTASGIGALRVEGVVKGGGAAGTNSGQISVTKIGSLRVGSIEGGAGARSGLIEGTVSLGRLIVDGDVTGGTAFGTGAISGGRLDDNDSNGRIGAVIIRGQVRGGGDADDQFSGAIHSDSNIGSVLINGGVIGAGGQKSGAIDADRAIGAVTVGSLTGSSGFNSGVIVANAGIGSLTVNGNIRGGTGAGSGGVRADGTLSRATIAGSIIGGDSSGAASLVLSGYVSAGAITNFFLNDDLVAGENNGTALAGSGTIRADAGIGTLRIHGNVLGNAGVAAIIAARTTIGSLQIDGTVAFAEILAGYGSNVTAANARGDGVNADARIGTVRIIGGIQSTSIVAGADAGADAIFGTADDRVMAGSNVSDVVNVFSQIANIIVSGSILGGATSAAITAQHLVAVSVNGSATPLQTFPGNDGNRSVELAAGTGIRVFELPLPA